MITVNGSTFEGKDGMTVEELIKEHGFRMTFIAVEVNGRIIKKDEYSSTQLNDGDKVEVVNFVGGG